MARITVEDCLTKENNRFALVQLAAKRSKQILTGSKVMIGETKGNKAVVTALREIAAGFVRFMSEEELRRAERERREHERQEAESRAAAALASAPVNGAVSTNGEQSSQPI
jgi:DNA-directed RNA polymerase subunit omega